MVGASNNKGLYYLLLKNTHLRGESTFDFVDETFPVTFFTPVPVEKAAASVTHTAKAKRAKTRLKIMVLGGIGYVRNS